MDQRGWDELDVLFVSGDAYVDHPAFGVPLLARLLEAEGYRVGILAQPDWRDPEALRVMGRPRLFAAIAAGAMDSMVNHFTAAKKRRNDDAYTPGGRAGVRPNRATIAYCAAIKGVFKGLPVVIGGIEASLRRLAHYDYWDDSVRRSILVDSKADLLVYGMAETALVTVARRLAAEEALATLHDIPGTVWLGAAPPDAAVILPSYEDVARDRQQFAAAFRLAEAENNPYCGRPLAQQHGTRWLVVNSPALPLTVAELDRIYALPFSRLPHPAYREPIPAYEQIRFSLTAHRGCSGGCAFCALTSHQGKLIQSRSQESLLAEVNRLTAHPQFRGTITDLGGPTANMYGTHCGQPDAERRCRRPSCLHPHRCSHLQTSAAAAVRLLQQASQRPGVKHLYVASGLRLDLLQQQPDYLQQLLAQHVGGLLKVAPEATCPEVLQLMRKPAAAEFFAFLQHYRSENRRLGRRQGVVPYLMAGHPGMTLSTLVDTALALRRHQLQVEQVQEFTPTPGTLSTCIYYTGFDPYSGAPVHVPRDPRERQLQKALLLWHRPENHALVRQALQRCGRMAVAGELLGR